MYSAIKGAMALVLAGETALEGGLALIIEAFARVSVPAPHRSYVLTTVAASLYLDGARLTVAGMAGILARVNTAIELLAADVSARSTALV